MDNQMPNPEAHGDMKGAFAVAAVGASAGTLVVGAAAFFTLAAGPQGGQGPAAALQLLDVGAVLWVGALLTTKRPDNAVGPVLMAGGLIASLLLLLTYYADYALLARPDAPAGIWALVGEQLLWPSGYFVLFSLVPLVFPDGRFLSVAWRYLALGMGLLALIAMAVATLDVELDAGTRTFRNPVGLIDATLLTPIQLVWTVLFSLGTLASLGAPVIRYLRSDEDGRRQIRWAAAAIGLTVVVLVAQQLSRVLPGADPLPYWSFLIPLGCLPAAIGFAVLRHRLFDIDLVIRRSFVYGALWLAIVVVYASLAAALGLAAGLRSSIAAAVVVTLAATLLFQPARSGLERLADRVAYGRRAEAYEVLRDFGAATEHAIDVGEIGPRLADAARRGMGARWARVVVDGVSTRTPELVLGLSGSFDGPIALAAPLVHRNQPIGAIECGPKLEGGYTERDAEVLRTLGRQAALAIQNAGLNAELLRRIEVMNEQARELAVSRARIVEAQEVERRRIERDLHDGVQQQLISLVAGIRLARNRLRGYPAAEELLSELQVQALQTAKDLRELARGIHPALLEDAGLEAAVEAVVARLPLNVRLQFADHERSQRFPPHVESAAYFVVCEALTNVMKHACTNEVSVAIRRTIDSLVVSVSDPGRGFAPDRGGSGLAGLRDRVAALGGELQVDSEVGRGTTVTATLPDAG